MALILRVEHEDFDPNKCTKKIVENQVLPQNIMESGAKMCNSFQLQMK